MAGLFRGRESIDAFNDLDEPKALVAWAKGQYERAKSARSSIERQWRLNAAFYFGRQNVSFLTQGVGAGRLITPKVPPYIVRSVTNRIRPIIRTEYSRVTQNKPSASVVPASSEDRDLFAAQAAEQVWESEYSLKNLHNVYGRAAFWMLICGTSFMKTWWNSEVTSQYIVGKNPDGSPLYAPGDIMYAPVTPFHLFVPDIREPEIENQPFVMNVYVKPVEWAKQTYGQDFPAEVSSSNEIMEDSTLNLSSGNTQPDSVLVLEVWLKPGSHRLLPNGGYLCIVSNKIVSMHDEMLYQHNQYPFIKFEHIPTGGFYADSVINDLILPQREYNRTRSQMIESKNRMSKPQLMAPKGSVDPAKITTEPGQLIEFNPGFGPPQPLPLQNLPSYVSQELDIIKMDMEDISSQHEVSRGQAPGSVTAATAISFLQEKDDSAMAHTYQSIEAGWQKIARQALSHVVQFWDIKRIVKVTGVDGSFDALMLKGSEIASGTDIRIDAGSSLPTSKAARQAYVMDLMKMGFIDPSRGLELMEIGGTERFYEQLKIDERQAQRENLRMQNLDIEQVQKFNEESAAQMEHQMKTSYLFSQALDPEGAGVNMSDPFTGTFTPPPTNIVPVNTWDNHAIHIDVHNRFRKSQAFESLPDVIKQQFEAHVRAHADALNAAAMGAQMMGGAPMGGDVNAMFPGSPDPNMGAGGPPPQQEQQGQPPNPEGDNQFGPGGQGPMQMGVTPPMEGM